MAMKKLTILLIACLGLTSGCKKFLDVEPKGKAIPTDYAHFNGLLNNPYLGGLQHLKFTATSNAETGEISYSFSILGDVEAPFYMADDVQANPATFNNFSRVQQNFYKWADDVYLPEDNAPEWGAFYSQNYVYNLVIQGTMESRGGTDREKNMLVAEARAVRAYLHFYAAQLFAAPYQEATAATDLGIPLVLEANTEAKGFTRSSNQELYSFIVNELEESIPLLNEQTINRSRLSQLGGYYMLGQVYFQMQKYDLALKAFQQANGLVAKSQIAIHLYDYNVMVNQWYFPFMANMGLVNFPDVYTNEENIFVKQTAVPITSAFATKMLLRPEVYALFKANDERKKIYSNKGLFSSATLPGFQRAGPGTFNLAASMSNLLLMKAECEARAGNLAAAQADLLMLRKNRMPLSDAQQSFSTKEELVKAILDERLREFAATGIRWLDMRRLANDNQFNNLHTTRSIDGSSYTLKKERLTLRIPAGILAHNPSMQNNP